MVPQPRSRHYTESSNWLAAVCAIVFALISISRTVALYQGGFVCHVFPFSLTKETSP